MAVKKKSAAKKAAPKKSAVKKSTAKKTAAKKKVAKKSAVKKTTTKKTAAKKKVAKKSAVKKTTTKKKTVKKSAARKSSGSQVVIPPVPSIGSSSRVNVSTTPAPATPRTATSKSPSASASKPAAKSLGSSKILFVVLIGILLVGAFVISGSEKDGDDAPAPVPAVTETAEAEPTAAPEETMETTEPAATTGEAPTRFIGNWKDAAKSVMVITWNAPAGDINGYKVETRANLGEWKVVSEVSAMTNSAEFAKSATDGSTSFRVSAVYADGTIGVATPFGFAGQFE